MSSRLPPPVSSRAPVVAALFAFLLCPSAGCATGGTLLIRDETRTSEERRIAEVAVETFPAGCQVEVNGKDLGPSPVSVRVEYSARKTVRGRKGCELAVAGAVGDSLLGAGLLLGAATARHAREGDDRPLPAELRTAMFGMTLAGSLLLVEGVAMGIVGGVQCGRTPELVGEDPVVTAVEIEARDPRGRTVGRTLLVPGGDGRVRLVFPDEPGPGPVEK